MQKAIFVLTLLFVATASQAQKWAVRGSFNMGTSYNNIKLHYLNDPKSSVMITGNALTVYFAIRNRYYKVRRPSNHFDISLIRYFKNQNAIIIGYRNFEPLISSTIGNEYGNHIHEQGTSIPTFKLNYLFTLLKSKKVNPSTLSIYGGVLLHFKGADGTFGGGGWSSAVGAVDSSGNRYMEYISAQQTGFERPKHPTPYINLGIDWGLRLGRHFKTGITFEASAGYKTLYTQKISGQTNSAQFAYDIKLKKHFFSGGIYLQYRLK